MTIFSMWRPGPAELPPDPWCFTQARTVPNPSVGLVLGLYMDLFLLSTVLIVTVKSSLQGLSVAEQIDNPLPTSGSLAVQSSTAGDIASSMTLLSIVPIAYLTLWSA